MKNILYTIILILIKLAVYAKSNPVAVNDTIVMNKNQTEILNLLKNDYDIDGDPIILEGVYWSNKIDDYTPFITKISDSSIKITTSKRYYGTITIKYLIAKKIGFEYRNTGLIILKIQNSPKSTFDSIYINNITAGVASNGDLFWDNRYPSFRNKNDGDASSIYLSTLWIGGYDDGGNLHVSAQTFSQFNSNTFQ